MSISRIEQAREAKAHRLYAAAKPTNLTPAVTYGNANTDGWYMGNNMGSPRDNADAHMQHASRDSGAQIVRCV